MGKIASDVNKVLSMSTYPGLFPTATVNRYTGTTSNIIRWQKYLNWFGIKTEVDGLFGTESYTNTKKFKPIFFHKTPLHFFNFIY
jgi:hypothetical protein